MTNIATKIIKIFINIRLFFFFVSWLAAVCSILWSSKQNFLVELGVYAFGFFMLLALPFLRKQNMLIIVILLLSMFLLFPRLPNLKEIFEGGKFILIFAGLIPTMGLVKAAAKQNQNIKKTQVLLNKLPPHYSTSGLQITGHVFGAIINTGVFPILAASIPQSSNYHFRKASAEAAIRGMSSSAIWSPFFVAFAVGQTYIDSTSAWLALAIGLIIALIYSMTSILVTNPNINANAFIKSLECLKPILPQLSFIVILIVGSAIFFNLPAISAVILTMPILITIFCLTEHRVTAKIISDTSNSMRNNVDDVVIISLAMFIGYFVTKNDSSILNVLIVNLKSLPDWSILILIPFFMTIFSIFGIHPVITSTLLLTSFTSADFDINPILIMQSHLIGWCTGTMSSIVSLSVITCSNLFSIPSHKLAFGPNIYSVLLFSLLGGSFLSLLNEFLA